MLASDNKSALAAMLARIPGQSRTSMVTGLDKKKGARDRLCLFYTHTDNVIFSCQCLDVSTCAAITTLDVPAI